MGLFDFFSSDIAIDLGTANTLIISKDKIVVDEPSIIAIDKNTNKVLAIGREAMQMHEKTHENIKTIRPLKDGVIAEYKEIAVGVYQVRLPGKILWEQRAYHEIEMRHYLRGWREKMGSKT